MAENIINLNSVPACYRLTQPASKWRLARRNGELILQAGSIWTDGIEAGIEWENAPEVTNG